MVHNFPESCEEGVKQVEEEKQEELFQESPVKGDSPKEEKIEKGHAGPFGKKLTLETEESNEESPVKQDSPKEEKIVKGPARALGKKLSIQTEEDQKEKLKLLTPEDMYEKIYRKSIIKLES